MDKRILCELLECSVCLESFNECNNKVLPCQHTFCRFCLDAIISVENRLICPECRLSVDTKVDDLPSNVLLNRILSTIKNPQSQDVRKQREKRRKKGLSSLVDYGIKDFNMPCAKALYSYNALENGDLSFKKDDIVELLHQVDENWFVGRLDGRQGFIPSNYTQVLCPLPSSTSTRRIDHHRTYHPVEENANWDNDCPLFDENDLAKIIPKDDEIWSEEIFRQKIFHDELNSSNRLPLLQSKLAFDIVDEQSQFEKIVKPTRSEQSTNEHLIMASSCDFIGSNESRTSSQSTSCSYPNLSNASKSSAIGSLETEAADTANEKNDEQNDTLLVRPIFDGDGILPLYRALCSYNSESTCELDLEVGKMYVALKDKGAGWLLGKSVAKGTIGLFPVSHVKFIKNWNYLVKDEKGLSFNEFKISSKKSLDEPSDHHHHHLPSPTSANHLPTPAKQSNSCDDLSTFDLLNFKIAKQSTKWDGKKDKRRSANVESMLSCIESQQHRQLANERSSHRHQRHAPEMFSHCHHHPVFDRSNHFEPRDLEICPDDRDKHSSKNQVGRNSAGQLCNSYRHERSPDVVGNEVKGDSQVLLRSHLRLSSIAYGVSSLIHRNMVKQKMMNKRCMSASASRCK